MTRVEKLVSISGSPILLSSPTSLASGSSPMEYSGLHDMLGRKNGFYAFEGALHVFGDGSPMGEKGLQEWNADALWRKEFDDIAPGALFFAEDVFGVQFCLLRGSVWTFNPETGEFEPMASNLEEWATKVLDDYRVLTGYPVAHDWQIANGPIAVGYRLVPTIPFIFGGPFSVDNVHSLEAVEGMHLRASIARQVRDLPDGSAITLRVVD